MAVSFSDLQLAFEFVSSGGMGENEAYLDRRSGKIYWHSEFGENDEELPDDIDDEKYISIPDKRELDLGKPLVLDFAREFLPDDYDEVRQIFSRRGAYRRYKELLVQRGASNGGTISRMSPRRRLCGSGARRTGSKPAGPEVTLLRSTDGLDERGVRWNPSNSLLSRALIRLRKAGLRNMMRMAELKVRIHSPPAVSLRTIGP